MLHSAYPMHMNIGQIPPRTTQRRMTLSYDDCHTWSQIPDQNYLWVEAGQLATKLVEQQAVAVYVHVSYHCAAQT